MKVVCWPLDEMQGAKELECETLADLWTFIRNDVAPYTVPGVDLIREISANEEPDGAFGAPYLVLSWVEVEE